MIPPLVCRWRGGIIAPKTSQSDTYGGLSAPRYGARDRFRWTVKWTSTPASAICDYHVSSTFDQTELALNSFLYPLQVQHFQERLFKNFFRPFHASTETDVAEECLFLTSIDRSIFFRTAISPAFPPKAAVNFESERAETPPSRSLLLLAVLPEGLPLTVSIAGYKIAVLTQWSSSAGFRAAHQKDITIEDIYTFYFLNGFSLLVYFSLFSH